MKHIHLHLHDATPRVTTTPARIPSTVIKPAPGARHQTKPRRTSLVKPMKPAGVIKPQRGVRIAKTPKPITPKVPE